MTPGDRTSRRILVGVAALLGAGAVGASPWEGYRLFLRGLLEERAGRPAAAAEMYENVLKRDPEAPAVRAALVEACLAAGRWDAALQTARSLADGFPESVEFQILLGRAYLAAGQSDKAQGAFDRALKLDPANVDALGWATSQTRLTNPAVAAGALEKFLKESGDGEVADAVRDRLAKLLEHEGNAAGAERHWKKILESDPGNVDALLGLAGLYDVRGDTAAAVAGYEDYVLRVADNPEVNARLGQLYFQAGDMDRARSAFDRAAQSGPRDPVVNFWRALVAQEEERWADAAQFMAQAARVAPQTGVLLRLASYYQRLGRPRDTVKTLARLQKAHPENPDFMQYLGQAQEDNGRPRQAIAWYERALKIDPKRADVQFRLAMNWDRLHRFDKALPALRNAIAADPRHHLALNYLGYSLAERGENLPEALDLIQRAVALAPDNAAYRDSLGWAYFRLGRLAEAETALAASVHPADDPAVWLHYGDVLEARGKKEESMRAWQEGLLLDPNNKDLLTRLGDEGRIKNVAPRTAARTLLKRVEGNFRQLRGLSGFVEVDGRWRGRAVAGRGVWHYARPGLFRLEILGPLFAPAAVMVHTSSGTQWYPPELGDPAVDGWLALLNRVLSGDWTAGFDDPAVTVRLEGDEVVYDRPSGTTILRARTKTLSEARVPSPEGPLRVRFERVVEKEGLRVPTVLRLESEAGSLTLTFTQILVNPPRAGDLFSLPAAP